MLGHETSRLGLIARGSERRQARELLERVGLDVDPSRRAGSLPVAAQQRVEIAKALAIDAKVVIMDEPTATLTEREIEDLFERHRGPHRRRHRRPLHLAPARRDHAHRRPRHRHARRPGGRDAREGSHRRARDRPPDGRTRDREPVSEGRRRLGDVLLRVEGITRRGVLRDCSFEVHKGEILGFAGIMGAGPDRARPRGVRRRPNDGGRIELDGEALTIRRRATRSTPASAT